MTFIQIFTSCVSLVMLLMIVNFLRRETLKEKYSLLWFMTIIVVQTMIFFDKWINRLAAIVGVFYPPSLIFFLAILFLFIILLHLSLVVSKLTKQNQILAQRLALLESRSGFDSNLAIDPPPDDK